MAVTVFGGVEAVGVTVAVGILVGVGTIEAVGVLVGVAIMDGVGVLVGVAVGVAITPPVTSSLSGLGPPLPVIKLVKLKIRLSPDFIILSIEAL
ncbi:MAG: hypothetical protein ACM3WV_09985 [Bacillota bacterium]